MAPDGPTDVRLALVLRRLGAGGTIAAAGLDAGVTRKTILRWRSPGSWCVTGFAEACDRVTALATVPTPDAREEIERIVLAWTPSGGDDVFDGDELADDEQEPGFGDDEQPSAPTAEPDVLDTSGREIVASRPPRARLPAPPRRLSEDPSAEQLYPSRRAPTRDEWVSMMADLAMDPLQPASVRCAAIASGNASFNQAAPRRPASDPAVDPAVVAAARERGREPGVPAGVWQEARKNFLGPAPGPAPDAERSGDVVEFERAPG
jgi:hypothetical protein